MANAALFSSEGTVKDLLLSLPWPVEFFSPDDLPGFLDSIYVVNAAVIDAPGALSFQLSLMFVGEAFARGQLDNDGNKASGPGSFEPRPLGETS